jgi:glycosyltransferase involved in cell wall biosynthesis
MQRRNNFQIKLLSVILPAYKQEKTIYKNLEQIDNTLQSLGYPYEIIVVIDGVVDQTYQQAKLFKSRRVKIIRYGKNQGKGHAVRLGMMQAKGNVIGFIDAGMEIHPAGFKMLLNHMEWYNADIIVGSKLHPASKVNYPWQRTILSWGYRFGTFLLFGFKVRDTQVGLKFFKRNVVQDVIPRLLVKRYAFDIEILAVAYARGYRRIYEAPVEINFNNATSIVSQQLWETIFHMLWDTAAVFYRLRILHYYRLSNRVSSSAKKSSIIIS